MNHKLKTASLRSGLIAIEWNTRSASNGILDRDEVESVIGISGIRTKLEDIETRGNQPIIWIDDPISSLDSNHIFFIYTLISSEILTHEKDLPERYKQLFISTHNLHFLKYLKRLPGAAQDEKKNEKNKEYRHFVIERQDSYSTIKLMPRYLREYVTEFNYLFEQLYKCATIEMVNDQNYTTFYNFGNKSYCQKWCTALGGLPV